MQRTIEELIEAVKSYNAKADAPLIKRAYDYAARVHLGQMRLSGAQFITHPLNVAFVLAELEQDQNTIIASLLHDSIEDGGLTEEMLAKDFSAEIAKLVEGVTKLGQLTYESREERQAENFRKMFLAMGEDIRIIIIKLADRLHNMQTLEFLPPAKQKDTAVETREIFAPLAHRLGVWRLKWELEDLSFKFLEPDKFIEIRDKISQRREERENYIADFIEKLKPIISGVGISAEVTGRAKHFFSIYKKMVDQNLQFEDIYDLIAVRVIVDGVKECYAVLGVIHASFKPLPGRFRDYIAMPKSNGYQSLHTTVVGPLGRPVEIQIRTKEMHRVSEYGIAAHWRYKEGKTDKELDIKMAWLRQMLDSQTELKDAKDFMDSLKIDLFVDEVFVFTPKGSVLGLPVGACPVDFAYHVHTEVGHRCMGAKVNGRIVPLDCKLKSGDIVEVITGKSDNPKLDWLNFVKTTMAKTKIKGWFKREKREENIERGKLELLGELKKLGVDPASILSRPEFCEVVREHGFESEDDFFSAVGYGEISAFKAAKRAVVLVLKEKEPVPFEEARKEKAPIAKSEKKHGQSVTVSGVENVMVRFSRCCRPLPGDEIVGFVTKGRGVSVHKHDCENVQNVPPLKTRLIKVEWIENPDAIYSVEIEVEAFDRVGVLKDILEKVVETKTNVSAADVKTKRGSSAIIKLVVDIRDINHLTEVMKAVRDISDVYDVYRTDSFKRS
jgi:GTP pyrophosphokinase